MKFSERIGETRMPTDLLREKVSEDLTNKLWNVILEFVIEPSKEYCINNEVYSARQKLFRDLWWHFFKYPIDTLPTSSTRFDGKMSLDSQASVAILREWFFNAKWFEKLDLVEFIPKNEFHYGIFNGVLQSEFSAYRFVNKVLVEVNSEQEIIEIENAIGTEDTFKSVTIHLTRALNLLADKKNPDYRNSIKESISAVESMCNVLLGSNDTLGKTLSRIETKYKIPSSLKSAFKSLYGYTSEEGGIRHGLSSTDVQAGLPEARFMLITCSAFINYLKSRMD